MNRLLSIIGTAVALVLLAVPANAGPFASPGDLRLRHDLERLDRAGLINVPLTTWPIAWGDLVNALDRIDALALAAPEQSAYARLRTAASDAMRDGAVRYKVSASAALNPRVIRTFEDTPRESGQLSTGLEWTGNRFAFDLNATYAVDPDDDDDLRPDGTFAGVALGNWMVTAGWQARWWGPGRDGSLILSGNARPVPALAIQRNRSTAFESRWLRWIGPWTLTGFAGLLDDERTIDDALLLGVRAAFRPIQGLEIGISRSAQVCGDGRPCDASTFADLLVGNDNRGVNVEPGDEPGNQLGGIDLRWSLPGGIPLALYAQWIAEDSRRGGPEIGSWLRQAGMEFQGVVGSISHRSHFEVSETSCRDGGLGFSELVPNCAYEHGIYQTGYRYGRRAIGHGMDSDGLSYSAGATLVQSAGHAWSVIVRHMEINRAGPPGLPHTLSVSQQDRLDVQLSHRREIAWGAIYAGFGFQRVDDVASSGDDDSEMTGFIQWSTQ